MDLEAVHALVDRIDSVDVCRASRDVLRAGVADVARLSAWCQAKNAQFAAALAKISSFPEKDLADAARTSLTNGNKQIERANTVDNLPAFGDALADGDVSGEHVDVIGNAWRRLPPGLRPLLADQADQLAEKAKTSTPGQFAALVGRTVRDIEADDGISRLTQQRRAASCRTWIDPNTGMWTITARFDPLTGAHFAQLLDQALAARYSQPTPPDCPTDPEAKNNWLRAHALADLINNPASATQPDDRDNSNGDRRRNSGSGGAAIIVVIDATAAATETNNGRAVTEWGIPVEIPDRILIDLAAHPNTTTNAVIIRNGIILHAEGLLDLGRTTRLANRAQRRVLRALYSTCPIPGCETPFNLCVIHHITWWRNNGTTNLLNLVPLCIRHHHNIHDHGWQLTIADDRSLTITLPDQTRMTTGPPRTRAN